MSNYYWNEYMKHYVDNDLLLNTLKYHQRTINRIAIQEKIDDEILELCEANKIKVADIKLSVHEVKNSHVDKILKILNENYGRLEAKVSFPLIIFLNCKYGYKSGIYSYDFIKKKLLLIGDIKESIYNMLKEIDQSYDIIIPFYLNVVQALAVFGNKGYIRGIEEIGYIYGAFKEKIPEINKIIFPEQEFTHEIGINLRKALLIDAIIL